MGRGNYVGRKGVVLTGVTVGSQRDRIFVIKLNLIRYNRSTRRSFSTSYVERRHITDDQIVSPLKTLQNALQTTF